MPADASLLLWLAASLAAAAILFGSSHRRRSRLTESLRAYVRRSQGTGDGMGRSDQGSAEN
jgi:hypothetical protein